ncbi:MAG: phosphatidate cytidylyltransferase [Caldisericia bacterium]
MNLKRVIAAVILIPIVLLVTIFGSVNHYPIVFLVFLILISTIGVLEGVKIAKKAGYKTNALILVLANITLQIFMYFPHLRAEILFLLFALFVILFVLEIFKGKPSGAIGRIGAALLIFGIGGLFSLFMLIQKMQITDKGTINIGFRFLLTLFAGVWSFDIFSYYGGKFAGRHKLAPSVSPGKTWEGLIIGTIIGWVVFVITSQYLIINFLDDVTLAHTKLSLVHMIIAGGVVVLFSLLGDLSESILKRSAGVKDSSKLIMGHGGILDRMDSLLFAVPAFLFYLLFFIDKLFIV